VRDLIIVGIVLGALPFVLARPYIGVLLWSWIGYMNPHRFTWGFAYTFPFAALIGATTLLALFISREKKRLPVTPLSIVWFVFLVWITFTTIVALDADSAWSKWDKVIKIQLMTLVTMMIMGDKQRIQLLIWIIALSLGFFGIKGGIFTVLTGGAHRVGGPEGSFITGNTEIGLALIMTLPLLRYLQLAVANRWVSFGLLCAMGLTAIAIIGTHSRGALLGGAAMIVLLWFKSRKKAMFGILALMALPAMINFMPDHWFSRMETIKTYEEDLSAMQRVFAWQFGYDIASSRFTGGGFGAFSGENYRSYSPDLVIEAMSYGMPEHLVYQAAHSIYFGVLGEHGFIGLILFLLMLLAWWKTAGAVVRSGRGRDDLKWATDLAAMIQVSIVGYAVGGAFLSLEYFDLVYHLIAVTVLLKVLVDEALAESTVSQKSVDSEGLDHPRPAVSLSNSKSPIGDDLSRRPRN
jgi:probable O-glycosylation ligase (exosortase A-associated)